MIKPTTNLKKISSLKKRIWVLQGSQGSAKTYSVLILLINHAQKNDNKEIYICSSELSKMKITVLKDFKNIMVSCGYWKKEEFNKSESIYNFSNGSTIKFIGLDQADIGKGLRSDIVFINEANKINFETYRELTSRAKRIILDYNPNANFWVHDEVITRDDADFIILTFEGNEFLSNEERNEILRYKEQAYNEDGSVKSNYWLNIWNVYGRGITGATEGKIFENWNKVSLLEYNAINKPEFYLVDWGIVDPMAILKAKYVQETNSFYVHELNYASENDIRRSLNDTEKQTILNKEGGIVLYTFNKLQIPKEALIICDSAGKSNIQILQVNGYERAIGIKKEEITTGIRLLQSVNIFYTETSKNIDKEYNNYTWATDRMGFLDEEPIDNFNHTIDPMRYGVTYLKNIGLIKGI